MIEFIHKILCFLGIHNYGYWDYHVNNNTPRTKVCKWCKKSKKVMTW